VLSRSNAGDVGGNLTRVILARLNVALHWATNESNPMLVFARWIAVPFSLGWALELV
jgi:hypothetical protein